ncbi:MAG TPA: SpoIIE family protein phosphatase [Candidatus Sulfotelmatobacter sp.]|nr:SpoIIE family protein phosphatase [Candidatus Sulfotelmatobacter sp.]
MMSPERRGALASLDTAALDLLPDAIWVAGPRGEIVQANVAWRRLTRTAGDRLADESFVVLLHPDDLVRVQDRWRAHVASGTEYDDEYRLLDEDGRYRWYRGRAAAIGDGGVTLGWIGSIVPCEDEHRARERATLQADVNALFASVTDPDALIDALLARAVPAHADYAVIDLFDERGSFERVASAGPPNVRELLGAARERYRNASSIVGTSWHVAATGEAMLLNLPTQRTWSDEAERLYGDLGVRSAIIVPLTDGVHRLGSLALGRLGEDATPFGEDDLRFYADLAARAAAVISHARTTRELIGSERRYRALADGLPDLIAVTDAGGRLAYVNEPWVRRTGLRVDPGGEDGWSAVVHPDDLAALHAMFDRARTEQRGFEAQHRLRGRDQAYRWYLHRGEPIHARDALTGWIGTLTDIDERKRAEDALRIVVEASSVFGVIDGSATLQGIADVAIAHLADWCTIYLYDEAQRLRPAAVAHRDPLRLRVAREYLRRFPVRDDDERALVASTGRAVRLDPLPPDWLESVDDLEQRAVLASLDLAGYLFVPLTLDDQRLGVMSLGLEAAGDQHFNDEDEQLAVLLAQRAAIGIANARLYERQRQVARTLQAAFLPAALPAVSGVAFDGVYTAGTQDLSIGGDWYDALTYDETTLGFSVGDVAGHGLEAAVTMGKMRQTFRALAVVERDPARVLAIADSVLRREHPDVFVTAFAATYELRSRTLRYANAGHPAPFVRGADGALDRLATGGIPLGLASFDALGTHARMLSPGDLIVTFTDGLIETTRDLAAGEALVARTLAHPAFAICTTPAALLRALVVPDEPGDDIAILTMRVGGGPDWSFDANDSNAAQAARAAFVARLTAAGVDDELRVAGEVVFGEIVGNIARYTPGTVDLALRGEPRGLVLAALDRGPGFHWNAMPPKAMAESGRGLFLIEALARSVRAEYLSGFGTYLEVVLAAVS